MNGSFLEALAVPSKPQRTASLRRALQQLSILDMESAQPGTSAHRKLRKGSWCPRTGSLLQTAWSNIHARQPSPVASRRQQAHDPSGRVGGHDDTPTRDELQRSSPPCICAGGPTGVPGSVADGGPLAIIMAMEGVAASGSIFRSSGRFG